MNATLFTECPLPVCSNPVDDGKPCASCAALIAEGFVRQVVPEPGQPATPEPEPPAATLSTESPEVARLLAEATRKADAVIRRDAAERGAERMPGQMCWVCQERRTCRRDPEFTREIRWICKECETPDSAMAGEGEQR
jgi:hypothetical protein